jgi:PIN domain nuclease of toxin-antitoxin system
MMVLDSSAVIALLRNEPGAELVKPEFATGIMSSVNYAETLGRFERDRAGLGLSMAAQVRGAIGEIVPLDAPLAEQAAGMLPHTIQFGLSLGDRCCLALALQRRCTVLTADRSWLKLTLPTPVEIRTIR